MLPILPSEDAMMVDEPFVEQSADLMQIEPQSWVDIDELDRQDPQAVTQYVEEIYDNCREKEVRENRRFNLLQAHRQT